MLFDLRFDLRGESIIAFKESADGVAPLRESVSVVVDPRAGLVDDACFNADVNELSRLGDYLSVKNVKFRRSERRRELIFNYLDLRAAAVNVGSGLERLCLSYIKSDGGIELERTAARCCFGVTV